MCIVCVVCCGCCVWSVWLCGCVCWFDVGACVFVALCVVVLSVVCLVDCMGVCLVCVLRFMWLFA